MRFLLRTFVTAASLAVADFLLPGIEFAPPRYGLGEDLDRVAAVVFAAIALGVLNALVRPILHVITLPITCVTLGLFVLVINGVMLVLLGLLPFLGFQVHDFLSAILGGLVVSVVGFLLNWVVK